MRAANNTPKSEITGVPGWLTHEEEVELMRLAEEYVGEYNVVVTLGEEYGRSTAALYYAGPLDARHYVVDTFPDNHHYAKDHGGLLAVWQHNLNKVGIRVPNDVTPLIGDGDQHGLEWIEGPIHLLFVGVAAGYDKTKKIIEAWAPHIVPEGIIVVHNYAKQSSSHPLHKDAKRAVDEWHRTTRWHREKTVGTLTYFVKPDAQPPKWSEIAPVAQAPYG